MNKTLTTIFTYLLGAASVFATQPSSNLTAEQALQKSDKQFFIENKGQWHSDVLFLTRMGGLDVWITKYGVNYTFYQIEKNPNAKQAEHLPSKFENDLEDATLLGHRVLLKLKNHNTHPSPQGKIKQQGYYNYLIGNDPSKHASNVGLYKEAVVKNMYKGIDLRYYFENGYLRYDFIVQPGADPSQIKFELDGEFKEYLKNNILCYTTRFGEVQMQDLYVYQQGDKKQVQAKFTQQNGAWQFQLSNYDKTQPLIIDPLIYSTYIGGSNSEEAYGIALDGSGNAYITGHTNSTNYDITSGAFQTSNGGSYDVFVTKLNSTGTALIYSTYIGGGALDEGIGIAIDGSGNAYITGRTMSTNYDITPGAFQTSNGGSYDVFVTQLNSTGNGLIYSTYIGGSDLDYGYDIAIDGSGNAYITGITMSTNYDITAGAFQTTNGGIWDVFVTKLNSTGTGLIYSTYIGGTSTDVGNDIAIDGSGNAYITGGTISTNYYITPGAFQTSNGGSYDVFVTKLNSTGTGLIYSTYIGGSSYDYGFGIAIDGSGNAYITGTTNSTDYYITPGAFQTTNGGSQDVFVTQLNSTGTGLIYSTYIGGSGNDECRAIAIDGSGNAYITGYTSSTNYDITPGAFQTSNGGYTDVFVTKLNSTGTGLIYSTYIGGSAGDQGYAIAIDGSGNAYITGYTSSTNYDITPGAFQTTNGGNIDVFVTKLCPGTIPSQPGAISGNTTVCAGSTQTYSVASVSGASSYTWTLPSGWSGTSTTNSITATVGANGGNITVTANNACGSSTAQTLAVTVNTVPSQPGAISGSATVCAGSSQTYNVASVSGASSYTWTLPSGWSGTSTTNSITATVGANSGNITVTANNACGSSTAQILAVTVSSVPSQPGAISGSATVCQGSSQNYSVAPVSGASSYTWTLPSGWTGSSTTNSISATVGANSGNITVTANNACGSSTPRTLAVTVNTVPSQPGAISGSATVCQGSSQTYSVAAVSGATSYTWTLPSGWTGSSTTNSISATVGANSGNITVTANNACGSSTAQTINITVNPLPNVAANASATTVCAGQQVTLTGSGATSYSWTGGVTDGVAFTPSNTDTYTVTGTDANGCSNTDQITITVNPLPNVTANASATTVCAGEQVTLTGSGAVTYTWTGGVSDGVAFTPTSTATYTVTGTDANGCSNTDQITITVNPLPNVTANASATTVCAGGQVTLTGSGAATYTWSGNVSDGVVFTPTSTATYTVTGTDANGCSNTDQITVTVNPLPNVTANASATTVCAGEQVTLTGSGAVTYTWTGGVSDGVAFTPSSTDTYTVTGTDANGCSNTDQITVTVNPLPNVSVSNNANTLTANQAGATYQWIDCNNNNAPISGAINQSFTPTTSGSYAVVVTLNGCVDTSACQTVTIAGVDTENLSKQVFSIYPNPNRGNFTIQCIKGGIFELIDITGKVMHTYTFTNTQQTINENIPAGMYFVREKESGSVQKVIVE
jgi:hypothetical protein